MLQRRMPGRLMGSVPLMGGGQTYIQKVQGIQRDNQILYHPMNEPSGGVAIDYSPEGNNGAYTGVTLGQPGIGDGLTCPLFDGANDYNDIYSAGFNTDFDDSVGTIAIWAKVSGAGIWTDNAFHWIVQLNADVNNFASLLKRGANDLAFNYKAGGTLEQVTLAVTPVDWFHLAITWDTSVDEVKAYYNGLQTGITQAGLGAWVGNLVESDTNIGAQTEAPANVWDGWLAHCPIWKIALTPAEVLKVATL